MCGLFRKDRQTRLWGEKQMTEKRTALEITLRREHEITVQAQG